MTSEPRRLSGRYEVDELIGRGGMATVYRGRDLTLGRRVAVKLLKRELAEDSSFRTRFRLEAQAASRMAHPSIVRVYDAGEDTETDADGSAHPAPYIVMELVDGRLLKDVIDAGPVPVADAVRYVDGILEALEYSHRAGVVHRDIKPGNVMLTPAGQIKVMDFGIARAVADTSSTVAETTSIIGTAAYFSPEQAKGDPVDARADLYSTGVVLYELLTGRTPFRGETPVAVAYQHVSEAPVPPSEVNPEVPRALDAVVLRALAKDPFQRYQSAADFREALDATIDGKAPTKRQLGALTNELYGPNPRQAAETARSLRQLSTDSTMRRTQSGPPVAWIWTGVAVLAALLVSVVIWVVSIQTPEPETYAVPDVVGMPWDVAEKAIIDADLVPLRIDENSPSVAEGLVIRSQPDTGTTVEPQQEVRVWVSLGHEMAEVPVLEGLTRAEAVAALEARGLQLGTVTRQNDPALAADIVMSAGAATGEKLPVGSSVNLVVSSGMVTLIDLSRYSVISAEQVLDGLLLVPEVVEDPNCPGNGEADPGLRIVQSSSAVGDVPINSTITLTVCTGEPAAAG